MKRSLESQLHARNRPNASFNTTMDAILKTVFQVYPRVAVVGAVAGAGLVTAAYPKAPLSEKLVLATKGAAFGGILGASIGAVPVIISFDMLLHYLLQ